jgi:hypothetical protein
MTAKKKPDVQVHDLSKRKGLLKAVGGSMDDGWNNFVAHQTVQSLWLNGLDSDTIRQRRFTTVSAMIGIKPCDELEGMLAAQLVACHNAAMECYRRAMIPDQTFEGRQENLNQANKLSRSYAVLLDALNRHRGKGQQKVTVEHVNVHAGGQAVVGTVATGGGDRAKSEVQPHASQIAHAPQQTVWSADKEREPVSVTSDAERPLSDARRNVTGSTKGQ